MQNEFLAFSLLRLLKKLTGEENVMLNSFQHLIESTGYETLKQVQGDRMGLFQHPHYFLLDRHNFYFIFIQREANKELLKYVN